MACGKLETLYGTKPPFYMRIIIQLELIFGVYMSYVSIRKMRASKGSAIVTIHQRLIRCSGVNQ
ncbi:hypothetical protein BN873_470094 [Candidatus Competibacter denitrificans Run_A_D11]|uniref:Uncharacterized protein n=1 Tax=Candidatus Competibacter denitrificans Run_A_D11 TaxID=1400863 RepID=W6M6P3_9GAMM|nr:hypothetical protein BN873_470094 [Candidatus Competibacter denitrificans Run_A_D11]